MAFIPRFTSDGMNGNPMWYDSNPFYPEWGLPNCTCYAFGRFWEIDNIYPSLSHNEANQWYYNTSDGYERGQVARLGAVICWYGGPYSGDGHVGIVEQINPDGSIITSNSALNGEYFYTQNIGSDYQLSGYEFLGFIYNPSGGNIPDEPDDWIYGNYYLDTPEKDSNAIKFYYTMSRLNCSYNAILGMLANIDIESNINPGIWENLDPYNGGYGLVQWTPYTKYSDWCGSGWENNGQKQCERIIYEGNNNLQWFGNPYAYLLGYPTEPPITLNEFLQSNLDPITLADYWLLYYEHPDESALEERHEDNIINVNHYNALLGGEKPTPIKKSNFILYCNKRKFMKRRGLIWR